MEQQFRSPTIFDFQKRFKSDKDCLSYLSELKWGNGYTCPKCGNTRYCDDDRPYSRQCTKCHYISSPTSGTLFHKVKFPLLKAFYIIYYVSTNRKGISSTELSRKLGLRQKTCWFFKQKAMRAMKSCGQSGKKCKNFPDLHRIIINFKSWQRGTHHRVNNLHAYIDEYCYRYNRNKMKEGIFYNLLMSMVKAEPMPYKVYCLNA